MNAPLRRVGVVVLVLFGLLFANLNWVQAYKADEYRNSDYNGRVQIAEYERRARRHRGRADRAGRRARPPTASSSTCGTTRSTQAYAHVIGYKPVNMAATGIEQQRERVPRRHLRQAVRRPDLATCSPARRRRGGNVLLTLSKRAQDAAFKELTNNRVGRRARARRSRSTRAPARSRPWCRCRASTRTRWSATTPMRPRRRTTSSTSDPDKPLINRALSETYPPGSTFKVIDRGGGAGERLHPADPDPGRLGLPARRTSGTDDPQRRRVDLPEAQVTLERGADRVVQHRLRPARRRARRRQDQGRRREASASTRRT